MLGVGVTVPYRTVESGTVQRERFVHAPAPMPSEFPMLERKLDNVVVTSAQWL